MVTSTGYVAEQWNNFFVLVGTGSAALTGLVFVALTINLKGVTQDATHRYRAINMLSGFTAAFIISALVLMGAQTYSTIGIEWLIVSLLAATVSHRREVRGLRPLLGGRHSLAEVIAYFVSVFGILVLLSTLFRH